MQTISLNKGRMVVVDGAYIFLPSESDYRDKVLIYLSRNLGKKVTINAVCEGLKLSYGYLHSTIYKLEAEKIINIEEVGNYKLLSLNFKNMLTIAELARVSVRISQEVISKNKKLRKINILIENLRKHKDILSIVLFGSQARLEAREKSDIDLLVILNETSENASKSPSMKKMEGIKKRPIANEIAAEIGSSAIKEFLDIQHFIIDYEMFKRMLQSKEEINVGKEALKDGIVLDGFENYWKIVGEIIG